MAAPDASRTVVNVAASMLVWASANRQSSELPAKAAMVSVVRRTRRVRDICGDPLSHDEIEPIYSSPRCAKLAGFRGVTPFPALLHRPSAEHLAIRCRMELHSMRC